MDNNTQLLSLCMIVKNEEPNLTRCLESIKGVVDEMIIVDTGSTDQTKEIALSYGAKVYDFEWVDDFSVARNYSIDRAKGEWILVLDADEALDPQTAQRLRVELPQAKSDAFVLLRVDQFEGQMFSSYDFATLLRLFRNRPGYRYERPYHEEIDKAIERNGGKIEHRYDWVLLHYGLKDKRVQGKDLRHDRAIRILSKAIQKNPDDPNLYVFLGSEYYNKGDYATAQELILRAINLPKPLAPGLLRMSYNILGYLALMSNDTEKAQKYALMGLNLHETDLREGQLASPFYLRHSLFILASARLETAYRQALDGSVKNALENAKKAKTAFGELSGMPDQPQSSIERLNKLIGQADQLILTLENME